MLTIKSDDMMGRVQAFSALIQGNKIPGSTVPETFKLLVRKLNGLGLGLEAYSAESTDEETEQIQVKEPEKDIVKEEITSEMGNEEVVDKGSLEEAGIEEIAEADSKEEI